MSVGQKIYLETTVWYQLVNYTDSGFKQRARQLIEQIGRQEYTIYISTVVLEEFACNRPQYRSRLERLVNEYKPVVLVHDSPAEDLALAYIENAFKDRDRREVVVDAMHAAIATTSNIPYIASYNHRNLLNIKTMENMNGVNLLAGYNHRLTVCPPFMFLDLHEYDGERGSNSEVVWEIKRKYGKRLNTSVGAPPKRKLLKEADNTVKRATRLGLRVIQSGKSPGS